MHSNTSPWVPVEKLVSCRRCGVANLAWQQSKAGRWYLCETRYNEGQLEANRRQFHTCPSQKSDETSTKQHRAPSQELLTWMQLVVNVGYRQLANKYHPDHGGRTTDMQKLNAAVEYLREVTA